MWQEGNGLPPSGGRELLSVEAYKARSEGRFEMVGWVTSEAAHAPTRSFSGVMFLENHHPKGASRNAVGAHSDQLVT